MRPVLLLVTYTAKPQGRERFLQQVTQNGILEAIRREEGCRSYDYFLSAEDDRQILLVEKWADEGAQQRHMAQPHMKQLAQIKDQWTDQTSAERIYLERGEIK